MASVGRVVKPKTRKGKRIIIKRLPQMIEDAKKTVFLHGRKCSEKIRQLTKDLCMLKKPDAIQMVRKNDITIFENPAPVQNLCKQHNSAMFVVGSHSKKRPDNLVIGRIFDDNVLDMYEFHVESYQGLKDFVGSKIIIGMKPCLIFNGPNWEQEEFKLIKSLFIDFFYREEVNSIRLQGLQHSISFTLTSDGKILIRSYKILMKKSGCHTPRVELEEIGPRIDVSLRRNKLPTEDLMKEACRQPKTLKAAHKKNITTDQLGTTQGRIHLGKQQIHTLQTRKMKGLKRSREEKQEIENKKQKVFQIG